jgi:hypothetical protein
MDMKKYDLWVKEQEDKKKAQKMETVSDKNVEAA